MTLKKHRKRGNLIPLTNVAAEIDFRDALHRQRIRKGDGATEGDDAHKHSRSMCHMILCARIQSMNCRMEPHTETSCWLSMRRMTVRMTDPMTCCAPAMPMLADCSTRNPVLASLSGFMK